MKLRHIVNFFDVPRHMQQKRKGQAVTTTPKTREYSSGAARVVRDAATSPQWSAKITPMGGNDKYMLEKAEMKASGAKPYRSASPPPKLVMSRAEQVEMSERCGKALSGETIGLRKAAHLCEELNASNFDDDLSIKKLTLLGLCRLAAGDSVGCLETLDGVLALNPNNRLALVYRVIACERSLSLINSDTYLKVRAETWQFLRPESDDYFAQVVSLTAIDPMAERSEIQSQLRRIITDDPANVFAWTALAGHSLSLVSYDDSADWNAAARKAACEALRLSRDNKLAYSVLWWSTEGLGHEEFRGELEHFYKKDGTRQTLYNRLDSEIEAIFIDIPFHFDPFLASSLKNL